VRVATTEGRGGSRRPAGIVDHLAGRLVIGEALPRRGEAAVVARGEDLSRRAGVNMLFHPQPVVYPEVEADVC